MKPSRLRAHHPRAGIDPVTARYLDILLQKRKRRRARRLSPGGEDGVCSAGVGQQRTTIAACSRVKREIIGYPFSPTLVFLIYIYTHI
jgi:hypothetical protein